MRHRLFRQNPDLVEKFTAAVTESLRYASGHPHEAHQGLTTYTKISSDALKDLADALLS
ncbi:hypothetical protein [Streptomyces sp. NPDC047043]|uniref:hypothetical protein n=1 Tax=Streptomyces sp. NPDC047043 TaxID=3154497 RepID=UPI0033E7C17F